MLNIRQILKGGSLSKGGLCMCVEDGDFFGGGEKRGFRIASV